MHHGGNIYQFAQQLGCQPDQVLDFSSNINPHQAVDSSVLPGVAIAPYAEPTYAELKQIIRTLYQPPAEAGMELFNGASAAIFALLRWLNPKDIVLYTPLYSEYQTIAELLAHKIHTVQRPLTNKDWALKGADNSPTVYVPGIPEQGIPKGSTVVFVNPSTPDGQLYELQALLEAWQAAACKVIIDESFLDFCDADSVASLIPKFDHLYIIKSLSKFYGCAGIRIGFILTRQQAIEELRTLEPAWKLSSLDTAYMQAALSNQSFIVQTIKQTQQWRHLLLLTLRNCNLFEEIYPSHANFLLAKLPHGKGGHQLQSKLQFARILIRVCDNFVGLDHRFVRFAVKDEAAINVLASSLEEIVW